MARPLWTALASLSLATSVTVDGWVPLGLAFGAQPSIVPFSVSKRNSDGPEFPWLSLTRNAFGSELNTCPVGAAPVTLTVRGTWLTVGGLEPAAQRRALPDPSAATRSGAPGL